MSRIYEALQQAQREKKGLEEPAILSPEAPLSLSLSPDSRGLDTAKRMIGLYQNIALLLPDFAKKVIQFVGSHEGEGTSSIAREFARVSTAYFGKKVLLLDADRNSPSQHVAFNIRPQYGWEDLLGDGKKVSEAVYQIEGSDLFISPASPHRSPRSAILDSPTVKAFLEELRQEFDLVVVDSSPAMADPGTIAFSRHVDGVILVLEAERTRWSTTEKVKDQILKNGGSILGIVFNKRRYHVPGFIYRWL